MSTRKPGPFAELVAAQARAMSVQDRTVPLVDGATWESIAEELAQSGLAWVLVVDALGALLRDPRIAAVPAVADFVSIAQELARYATLAADAKEAVTPLDTLLPAGAFGRPFADKAGRGEGAVKKLVRAVLPGLERKLKRKPTALEAWNACAARRGHGVAFKTTPTWGTPLKAVPATGAPASWARFQVIVSEVRKTPKP